MQFSELAEKRFSVRKFTGEPVPDEIIKKILKAGYVAPTGCNNQPQRILVLNTEETINKLRKCTKCHFDVPTAMLVCHNKDECWYRPYDGAPCGQVDAAIVTTHMMMEATELGIGTTWVMHFDPEAMRKEFSIPEKYETVALLVMGYAAEDAKPFPLHSEFRPEDEIIYYNHF